VLCCCNTEILQLFFFFSFSTPFSHGFCEPKKIAPTLNLKKLLKKTLDRRKGTNEKPSKKPRSITQGSRKSSINGTHRRRRRHKKKTSQPSKKNLPPSPPPPYHPRADLVRVLSRSSGYQRGGGGWGTPMLSSL
jgi:hypothetical protein